MPTGGAENFWDGSSLLARLVACSSCIIPLQHQGLVAVLAGSRITEHPELPAQTSCLQHNSVAQSVYYASTKALPSRVALILQNAVTQKVSKREHLLSVGQQRCLLEAQCPLSGQLGRWSGPWNLSVFPFPSHQFVHSFCAGRIFCAPYFYNFLLSSLHLVHVFLEGWSRVRAAVLLGLHQCWTWQEDSFPHPPACTSSPDTPMGLLALLPTPARVWRCCPGLWFSPSLLPCSSSCVHTADASAKAPSFCACPSWIPLLILDHLADFRWFWILLLSFGTRSLPRLMFYAFPLTMSH